MSARSRLRPGPVGAFGPSRDTRRQFARQPRPGRGPRFGTEIRLDRLDGAYDLLDGRPLGGGLAQTPRHQLPYLQRHTAEIGILVHHSVEHRVGITVPEGAAARRCEHRGLPQREHVGRGHGIPAEHLLRRHVGDGSEGRAARRHRRGVRGPRDTEVDDPRAVRGEQHVRGLEVPVHDALAVHRLQGLRDTGDQPQHRVDGQRPVIAYRVGEGGPRHIGGRTPRHRSRSVAVHDRSRVEPVHPARRGHLGLEPLAELGALGQLRPDHLDRDGPPARRVREIDPSHAAGPEPCHQAVAADDLRIAVLQRLETSRIGPEICSVVSHCITAPVSRVKTAADLMAGPGTPGVDAMPWGRRHCLPVSANWRRTASSRSASGAATRRSSSRSVRVSSCWLKICVRPCSSKVVACSAVLARRATATASVATAAVRESPCSWSCRCRSRAVTWPRRPTASK